MADTNTTNLNLVKPEVGASSDTWGTKTNNNWDAVDQLFTTGPALLVSKGGTGSTTASGARTNLGLGTGDSPQFSTIELGNASDTTLSRTAAGVMAVEGKKVVTEDANGNAAITGMVVPASSFLRNRIINGDMRIDQRNAGTVSGNTVFPVDRFVIGASQAGKFTVAKTTISPPAGFTTYIRVTSSSAYSVLTTDEFEMIQKIEGSNIADLDFGLSTAKNITLSFWVRSSLTGTFAVSFYNGTPNRSYAATYTINSANTWEFKTITIAGDTTGTWATDTTAGLNILWSLGAGSSVIGTAGSWQASFLRGVTGQTNLVATNAATWDLTGVQLEAGSVATPFERRQYGQELALCQRYYEIISNGDLPGGAFNSAGLFAPVRFTVEKRASPTMSSVVNGLYVGNNGNGTINSVTFNGIGARGARIDSTSFTGSITQGLYYAIRDFDYRASAEL